MAESARPVEINTVNANQSNRYAPGWYLRAALRDLQRNRWFIFTALRRDLKGQLGRTLLGRFWGIILPIVPVSAYLLLRLAFTPEHGDAQMHPAVYVCVGVTIWFLLSDLLMLPIRSMAKHRSILRETTLPILSSVTASASNLLFEFTCRAVFTLLVVLALTPSLHLSALWIIPALIPCMVFCVSLGILFMFLNLAVPDVEQVLSVVMRYLIFVSFAIFPMGNIAGFQFLEIANPFALMINTLRELLIYGNTQWLGAFAVLCGVALVLLPLSISAVYRLEPRIREYL